MIEFMESYLDFYNKGVKTIHGDEYTNEFPIPCCSGQYLLRDKCQYTGDYKSETKDIQGPEKIYRHSQLSLNVF